MRKLTIVILSFLLAFSGSAFAEGIDMEAMSTDELLALREQLSAEINERLGDDNALIGDGVYVAGVDIKPGMYQITCAAAFDGREFYINLFESKENYQKYDENRWNNTAYRLFQAALYEGGMATVNLIDGMAVEIYNGIGRVEAVKPDWMP